MSTTPFAKNPDLWKSTLLVITYDEHGGFFDHVEPPKGGVLWLTTSHRDGTVRFRIADTGTGIPADLLPRIFEPFVTLGKSKGTGLGLAIVKSVVESHGGTITVQSELGAGTTFEIIIPEAPELPPVE